MPKKKPDPTIPPDPPPAPPPGPEPVPVVVPVIVTPAAVATVTEQTPARRIGDVPWDAWVREFARYGAIPAAEASACYDAAKPHTAMALAQAVKESSLGQDASAKTTKNCFGIMVFDGSHRCLPVNQTYCLRYFDRWADAFAMFKRIISTVEEPYLPADISLRDYLLTYVGGPGCRQTNGQHCAPGNPPESLELYIRQCVERLNLWLGGTTPIPTPVPAKDPLNAIVGGKAVITYGWAVDSDLGYYDYGRTHGLNGRQHTGLDLDARIGQTLYTPEPGLVTCAGTGVGPGSWGTGCAAFPDLMGSKAGRVEIMLDSGSSLIFGHCSTALVKPGQRVAAGQAVATAGGMNGPHVHVESRVPGPNVYTIVDPRTVLKGGPTTPKPPLDLPPWLSRETLEAVFPPLAQWGPGPVTKLLLARIKSTNRLPVMVTQIDIDDGVTVTGFSDGFTVFSRDDQAWEAGTK